MHQEHTAGLEENWIQFVILKTKLELPPLDRPRLEIERIAREKSCDFIMLNTFSFQAPGFYKKHGYQLMTTIENAPTGHRHYYFKKDLT
jgi:hypothetical protein